MNTITLTGQVELQAADAGKPKRFSMTAYSGGPMRLGGFGVPVVVDAKGVSWPTMPAILRDHDATKIVGHADKIDVDKRTGTIRVEGVVSGTGEAAQEVLSLAANSFPWQASIGAAVERTEYVEAGQKIAVNGRTISGPATIVRAATLREVSFVPIGADSATSAAIAAKSAVGGRGVRMNEFDAYVADLGLDPAAINDTQRVKLRAAFDADAKAKLVASGSNARAIHELAERNAVACPSAATDLRALALEALEAGWTADEYENKAMMAMLRSIGNGPNVTPRDSRTRPQNAAILEASLLVSCGMRPNEVAKHFDERTVDAAVSAQHRGAGLQTVLRHALRATGQHAPDGRLGDGSIRDAFVAERRLQASMTSSTISISGILSNVANKMALTSFNSTSATWPKFARRASHSNFHEHTKYRLTAEGTFLEVAPGGELKHVTLTEDDKTNSLKTFGALLGIDRRDLINDDLNTLATVPKALGRMGSVAAEKAVYTALLANTNNFFHTDNGNVETGAGSALAAAGLNAALARFRTQTDSNADPLMIEPRVLLVPPALESTARALMQSTNVVASTTADTTLPGSNPFAGLAEVVVGSYLATAFGITNSSNAAWYLLCEPGDYSVVEIAFLNDMAAPTVETAELDFDRLGIAMRSYFDFGAALNEHRGGVRSAGS